MVQQHKTCTVCGETKLLDGFYKSKLGKYGVKSRCKPCELKHQRLYRETCKVRTSERDRCYREKHRGVVSSKNRKRRSEEQNLTKMLATVPLFTRWAPGEDALILADNGMTIYQKAIELGRTFNSAKDRRKVLLAKGGVSNDRANA